MVLDMPKKTMQKLPDTEFVLIFLGGLFVMSDSIIGPITNLGFGGINALSQYFEFFGIIIGLLMVVSAMLIYNTDGVARRAFATGALIFSILSLLAGGGFLTGFILGVIGSIFVLRHKG
jgi:hypothetical protein